MFTFLFVTTLRLAVLITAFSERVVVMCVGSLVLGTVLKQAPEKIYEGLDATPTGLEQVKSIKCFKKAIAIQLIGRLIDQQITLGDDRGFCKTRVCTAAEMIRAFAFFFTPQCTSYTVLPELGLGRGLFSRGGGGKRKSKRLDA